MMRVGNRDEYQEWEANIEERSKPDTHCGLNIAVHHRPPQAPRNVEIEHSHWPVVPPELIKHVNGIFSKAHSLWR